MKKSDLLFAAAVAGIAVIIFLAYSYGYGKRGAYVQVSMDGEFYAKYSLNEERDIRLEYEGREGFNELVIRNGKATVTAADCPDKLCVKQKAISKTGESIVCLPHKLVITVVGGEEAEYDGIAG